MIKLVYNITDKNKQEIVSAELNFKSEKKLLTYLKRLKKYFDHLNGYSKKNFRDSSNKLSVEIRNQVKCNTSEYKWQKK